MFGHELRAAIATADAFLRSSGKAKPKDLIAVREARETLARHGPDLLTMLLANKRGEPTSGLAAVSLVVGRAMGEIQKRVAIYDSRVASAAHARAVSPHPIDDALEKVLERLGNPPRPRPKELVKLVSDQMLADGYEPKEPVAKGDAVVTERQVRYALAKRNR
jgi:hypothetical protein